VSAEIVQEIIVKAYGFILRLNNLVQEVVSLKNVKLTVKVLLANVAVFVVTFFISDAFFLWVMTNLVLLSPLIYRKKGKQINEFIEKMNALIDEKIAKNTFLMKIERN
jgi:hypothetical protein